ncbi:MAG: hypothetical protein QOI89_3690, partial [Solirubrobacteraceae bacterium]|nr:hypothetical protein [Solirubrobacteraceae bacterium]
MEHRVDALGPTGAGVAQRVNELRHARKLTLRDLAGKLRELGRPIQLSALSKIEKGQRRVDTDDLVALALALGVSPDSILLANEANTGVMIELASTSVARRDYVARMRAHYGQVDLEVLTPLTEQGEHPPMRLREVFVAQAVRADPPPMELPRELMRRLIEAGELGRDDLPEGVDRDVLAKIRQAYQQVPARPVLQVLAEPDQHRLVLLGDPGAGKSTLARYLALTLTDTSVEGPLAALAGWLPLLVELRTYADARWHDCTFLDLIDHLHTTEGLGLPKSLLDTFLRQDGRAVVIFDGLDELFDPQRRETVARQIAGFAARYPRAR